MTGISIVIPTFNRAALVPLSIESILRQTHPAAEIIVVDDGSTDDTAEVLRKYGSRIQVVRQPNGGLSAARNTGIRKATQEWVGFLDDDDEFTPERLEIAAQGIQRHPSVDVHATNAAIVMEDGKTTDLFGLRGRKVAEWTPVDQPISWIMNGCFFAQSMVARRSALQEVGLFRKTLYEDMDMYVRLASRRPWIVDARCCLRLIRRQNTNTMSDDWRSRPLERCEALVRIHRDALNLADLTASDKRMIRDGLATYLFEWAAALVDRGDTAQARGHFIEASRHFSKIRSRVKALAGFCGGRVFVGLLRRAKKGRGGFVR